MSKQPWRVQHQTTCMLQGATAVGAVLAAAEEIVEEHFDRVCDLYDEPTITHADVLEKMNDTAP